jgi:Recombination endonuclease VII
MQGNSIGLFGDPILFRCTKCGEGKPRDQFGTHLDQKSRRRYRCSQCRECDRKWHREHHKTPKRQAQHAAKNMAKYGLTVDQYNAMAEAQGGVCYICRKPETVRTRLSVDHCHATGKVRGLLCLSCNNGLGWFQDDIGRMLAAVEYLKRHQ